MKIPSRSSVIKTSIAAILICANIGVYVKNQAALEIQAKTMKSHLDNVDTSIGDVQKTKEHIQINIAEKSPQEIFEFLYTVSKHNKVKLFRMQKDQKRQGKYSAIIHLGGRAKA